VSRRDRIAVTVLIFAVVALVLTVAAPGWVGPFRWPLIVVFAIAVVLCLLALIEDSMSSRTTRPVPAQAPVHPARSQRPRARLTPADWIVLKSLAHATVSFSALASTVGDALSADALFGAVTHLADLKIITLSAPITEDDRGAVIRPDGASRGVYAFTEREAPPVNLMVTPLETRVAPIQALVDRGDRLAQEMEETLKAAVEHPGPSSGKDRSYYLREARAWDVDVAASLFWMTGAEYIHPSYRAVQKRPNGGEAADFAAGVKYLRSQLEIAKQTPIVADVGGLKDLVKSGKTTQASIANAQDKEDYSLAIRASRWRDSAFSALVPWPARQRDFPAVITPSGPDLSAALEWLVGFVAELERGES
jgi:hypothetical protein